MNKSESKYFNTAVRMDKALLDLLETKQFEYITVSEICKKAEVNRSTFYLHYGNTYDLLEETTKYVLDSFASYFSINERDLTSKFAERNLNELNFISETYLYPYLSFVRDNRKIFSVVVDHQTTFDTNTIFSRLFENIFKHILDKFNYPAEIQKYIMMFYLSGITAVVTEWLKDDCRKSIDDISDIIKCCIYGKSRKYSVEL